MENHFSVPGFPVWSRENRPIELASYNSSKKMEKAQGLLTCLKGRSEGFFYRTWRTENLKFTQRSLFRAILAVAVFAALPGWVEASEFSLSVSSMTAHVSLPHHMGLGIDKGVGTIRELALDFKSSLLEPGEADGAVIPRHADGKADKPSATDPSVLFFVGVGLIVLAFLGRRILQK